MTPFMHRVQALLDGAAAPRAITAPSEPHPVPVATDSQVIVRSLAEQLVSEANAVLRDRGDLISLDDQPATRYQEATLDVEPRENFQYRPTWIQDRELYDPRYTALRPGNCR